MEGLFLYTLTPARLIRPSATFSLQRREMDAVAFAERSQNRASFFTVQKFSGLHCYVCHSRFYDTFLAADEDIDIDQALWGKGRFIVCNPMVAIQ